MKMQNIPQKYRLIYQFMYYFSRIGLWFLTFVLGPLCWLYSRGKGKQCPPINNSLLLLSATKLAHMIRTKQVSCEIIIRAYINRAVEVNQIVNAIVEDRFTEALEEAIELDTRIKNSNKSIEEMQRETPLLGVPITVKESIMVKGMSCNAGQLNLKHKSERDSCAVQRIKNAGAIIMAVTNTPELCMFWETFNKVTGLTNNPYDTARTVGGSSGGEAALISSGASVIGLGSDLAGSLRLPAFFTGIFAHKPSPKLTPIDGHRPKIFDAHLQDYLVTGPLTRYAEDLPLLMSVLSPSYNNFFTNWEKAQMRNMKVYIMEKENSTMLAKNVNNDIIYSMTLFATYLKEKYYASVEKIDIKHLHYSFPISIEVLLGLEKIESIYLDENLNFQFWPEFLRFITFRSNSTLPLLFYGIVKYLHILFLHKSEPTVYKVIADTKAVIKELLGNNGILLYPTFTAPAHYHYSMFHKVMDFSYVSIFNVLGLPATNCPSGFVKNLPIGFQIVAEENNDKLTLAVACEAEQFFGGWKQPEKRISNKLFNYSI